VIQNPAALECPGFDRDPISAMFDLSIDPADLTALVFDLEQALERIDCEAGSALRTIHRTDCRSRAPPANA
jgi:hypothetical protein